MCREPMCSASDLANVVFPAQLEPMTTMRFMSILLIQTIGQATA